MVTSRSSDEKCGVKFSNAHHTSARCHGWRGIVLGAALVASAADKFRQLAANNTTVTAIRKSFIQCLPSPGSRTGNESFKRMPARRSMRIKVVQPTVMPGRFGQRALNNTNAVEPANAAVA